MNTSNYLLQTLVTETMAGGFLLPPLLIGHPGAPTHFPSFPQTSVPVPVQAKQKINLFLSHVILAPVYLSMSVYWQRMLSSELLLKESIMTGKDTRLFNPTHLGLGVECGVITYVAYNSKTSSVLLHACALSRFSSVRLFATLCTIAHQAPVSMGFSREESWSGFHALLQGLFLTQGSNLRLLRLLHCRDV